MPEEISGYFPGPNGWLHGVLHCGKPGRGGILVVPPFGEERKNTLRPIVELGRALAPQGCPLFRFDFSGYGDSANEKTPADWGAWLAEATAALEFARQQTGAPEWTVLGLRLGSLTAIALADQGLAQRLILVDPPLNGENAWRELQFRLQIREALGAGDSAEGRGELDLGGYAVTKVWTDTLAHFELSQALASIAVAAHCLYPGTTPAHSGPWADLHQKLVGRGGSARPWNGKPMWRLGDAANGSTLIARITEILLDSLGKNSP